MIYICYENQTVAIVTQEQGTDKMEIEISSPEESKSWKFMLDDLVDVINFAKKCLIDSGRY